MDRQIITVDIAPGSNAQQRLLVSQGDIGRPLGVRVIQNGAPLDCSDYSAFLYVLKPDHNYYECTCTVEDNSLICWETAEQETPVAGECLAAIRIMDQDHDIGTATFVEFVEASPADLGYASESLVSSMTEFVDAAQRAAEEATTAVADVDNVNDVAVNASGHIVLSKVLGSTVTSDETVLQPADIENDLLATTAGKVLDALQGKTLKDLIDGVDGTVDDLVDQLGNAVNVELSPAVASTGLAAAIEETWPQIPAGKVFIGTIVAYNSKRFVCGFKATSETTGICIGVNYDGTAMVVTNNSGTFASYSIVTSKTEKTKVDYLTLINTQSLTNTYVTSNTYSGRSFASGVWLMFNAVHKGWVLESQIVPYASFKQATGIELRCMVSSTPIEVDVKYVSDTSFQAKYIGTMPDSDPIYVSCWAIVLS